jgi:hypothetical protein
VKAQALFATVSLALIALSAWLLTLAYPSDSGRRAVWTSAVVAFMVQLVAFAVVRFAPRKHVIAAWGAGAVLRVLALAIYALAVVSAAGLERTPALISLAAFFFVTMLVEPLLLKS